MMTDLSLPQKLNIKPKLPQNPDHFEIISIGAGAIVNLAHLPAYRFAGFTIKGIFDVDKNEVKQQHKSGTFRLFSKH